MDPSHGWIYHLALQGEWQEAMASGVDYRRSTLGTSLDEVGYIHCSFASQVQMIADAVYRGRDDIVLLTIDPARVPDEIRVESLDNAGQAFPHIYGPLPVTAVIRSQPVLTTADGRPVVEELLAED